MPPTAARAELSPGQEQRAVRLLQAACATSSFDRFVVGALLVSLAADLGEPLGAAAAVASAYFLCYGLSQPVWGLLSDRLGRGPTLRLALALTAVGAVASALAPGLAVLVVLRGFTGACLAAVVPAALVYVGDVVPLARRQRTLTDLNAATALGITAALGLGGVLAATVSWRAAFALPGVSAAVLALVLAHLPEPPQAALAQRGLPTVLRAPWGRLVLGLALVEGAALLGLLTYFTPALESNGWSATSAGPVVALYGVGLLLASRVVKRLAGRVRPEVFLGGGAAGLALAYAVLAVAQDGWVVGSAALLVGAAWAGMHSTMQTWATEAVPQARAAMVSMFAAMLFIGSGVATALAAPLADARDWLPLFGTGAAVGVAFGCAAVAGRSRYAAGTRPGEAAPPVT